MSMSGGFELWLGMSLRGLIRGDVLVVSAVFEFDRLCYAAFFFFSIACGMVKLRSSGFEVSVICIDFFLLLERFFWVMSCGVAILLDTFGVW